MRQQHEQHAIFQTTGLTGLEVQKSLRHALKIFSLLAVFGLLIPLQAMAANVTLEVNWPEYSGQNSVQIYDATNSAPVTTLFNDGVGSASDTSFSGTSPTYILTDGVTYTLRMTDSHGDGWVGSGAKVLVKVNGTNVMGSPGPEASLNPLPDSVTKSQQFVAIAPSQPTIGTSICTGDALPADAVNLSFADTGVDWPGTTYTPQTFTNIDGGGVQATLSWSDTSTFTDTYETSTDTGNGDTGAFFLSGGFGNITSTMSVDLSANPAGFVDMCNYHINFSGGNGDQVTYRAITENGTTLTNPTFSPAASPDYIYPSSNSVDSYNDTDLLSGILGIKFTAPSGDRIVRVEIDWTDASGGAGVGFQHSLGIGEIAFNNPGSPQPTPPLAPACSFDNTPGAGANVDMFNSFPTSTGSLSLTVGDNASVSASGYNEFTRGYTQLTNNSGGPIADARVLLNSVGYWSQTYLDRNDYIFVWDIAQQGWINTADDGSDVLIRVISATVDGAPVPIEMVPISPSGTGEYIFEIANTTYSDSFTDGGTGTSYNATDTLSLPATLSSVKLGSMATAAVLNNLVITYAILFEDGRDAFVDHPDNSTDDTDNRLYSSTLRTAVNYDYGDAPSGYGDAAHAPDPCGTALFLGTNRPDYEATATTGAAADGDSAGDSDDENGVVIPTLTEGSTANVTIAAADIPGTGTGTLHGWIDFDGDGSFEAGEYATVGFNNGASGDLVFSGYGTTMAAGTIYARFRLTSDTLNDVAGTTNVDERATTTATDGEVEDYVVTVDALPSGVTLSVEPVTPPPVCTTTSVHQLDEFSVATATGAGASGTPSLSYTAPTGNHHMMFAILAVERDHTPTADGRGDNFASQVPHTGSGSDVPDLTFGGVTMDKIAYIHKHFGLTNTAANAETSHEIIAYRLWGNQIPTGANSFSLSSNFALPKNAGDEATLMVTTFSNVYNTEWIGGQSDTSSPFSISLSANPTANGTQPLGTTAADNLLLSWGQSSDAESLNSGAGWTSLAQVQIENLAGTYATDAGRSGGPFSENDGMTVKVQSIGGVTTTQTASLSTTSTNISFLGSQAVRLVAFGCDYGDADASYGAPSHSQSTGLYLGTVYGDADAGAQPTGDATGDNADGIDDEDGVTVPTLTEGDTADVTIAVGDIIATGTGKLYGWIDFDGNGTFDAAEFASTTVTAGTVDGPLTFSSYGTIMAASSTFARFRLTSDTLTNVDAAAAASDGEIEDYVVTVNTPPSSVTVSVEPVTPPPICTTTSVHQLDEFSVATAIGAGANGTPSLSYTAPTGNHHMMFAILAVERDHTPTADGRGDNFASQVSYTGAWSSVPDLTFGGVPMGKIAYNHNHFGLTNTAADAETSHEIFAYSLWGNQIPTGANSFTLPSNFALPKNAGDEATLMVTTFSNVYNTEWIGGQSDASSPFSVSFSVNPTANGTQPLGTTAADNLLLSWGQSSDAESLNSGAGWTSLAQVQIENLAGTYATDAGRSGGPFSENDGMTVKVQSIGGVTTTQTASLTSASSDLFSFAEQAIRIVAFGCDYGDAGASYGAPSHSQSTWLYLGPVYGDADAGAQPTGDATGDNADGIDDEDGVRLNGTTLQDQVIYNNSPVTLAVTTTGSGRLHGWIDWDGNGVFGNNTNELIVSETANSSGARSITVTPPNDLAAGTSYARFRYSTDVAAANPTGTASNGEVEDYQIILSRGFSISGRVFKDSNVDTVNDAAESGVTDLPVVLYDTANGTCISTRTNANGDYSFPDVIPGNYQAYEASRESVPVPQNCGPANARDPSAYLSTTVNVSAAFTVSSTNITGVDFGDVKPPVFELDNSQTVLPNTTALHPHVFTALSDGSVSFSITIETADPATISWGSQLLVDTNCDGQLDSGDTTMPTSISVTAGQQVCILAKVLAPADVSASAMHTLGVQSEFIFGDGSTLLSNDIQTHQDITLSAAGTTAPPVNPIVDPVGGEGKLSLVKSVWNVTRNIDGEVALPGETLRYTISYQNIGNGPLNELIINDSVPAFTQLVPASMLCTDKPAELPLCAANDSLNGGLSWSWAAGDMLLPGSEGSVSYDAIIE